MASSGFPVRLRWCWLVLLTMVVIVAGCGSGRLVVPVALDSTTLRPPVSAETLTSHEAAVRGIATIMVNDLHLPVPASVTVYVYSDRQVFEQGLIQDAHVSPLRAAELSDFAIGVGKRRQLLLHDEPSHQHGREWLRLIAHELTHVSQIELSHGEGRAEQWLAEGMAEWVAFTVLDRLGLDLVSQRRVLAAAGIRNHAALLAARLDLETLGTPRGFTVRHLKEGSLPTYQLAFLMADYLIRRDGLPKVIAYFASFAETRDRREAFRVAFGQTLENFEAEVLAHLKTIVLTGVAAGAPAR